MDVLHMIMILSLEDFLKYPYYLLNSPLKTSYSCDTWLAVRHRGNLHRPKLQQVHSRAESALTLQPWSAIISSSPVLQLLLFKVQYCNCHFLLLLLLLLSLKLFALSVHDMMYIKFNQQKMLEMSLFFLLFVFCFLFFILNTRHIFKISQKNKLLHKVSGGITFQLTRSLIMDMI